MPSEEMVVEVAPLALSAMLPEPLILEGVEAELLAAGSVSTRSDTEASAQTMSVHEAD